MIIIQVAGGLGNQLQQYALYRKLVSLGKETRLDVSWFEQKKEQGAVLAPRKLELSYFDRLIYEKCTEEEKARLIGSDNLTGKFRRKLAPFTIRHFKENQMYHPEIFAFEDMYVSGYFACEKYYADILYDLRERIQFPPSGNPANEMMMTRMSECESVSVHIRRGDYLDTQNQALFGNICTDVYYDGAIAYMKELFPNAHFFLFSDDSKYVREHYAGEEYTVVDINKGADSFYDIMLMSHCKHHICANSTFSFWGARLNPNENKVMIRPTIHKNTQVFNKEQMMDLWAGWTFVDNKGKKQ